MATTTATPPRTAPAPARARRRTTRPPRRALDWSSRRATLVLLPVVLLAGAGNPPCPPRRPRRRRAPTGQPAAGMFAAPLRMAPGRWYRVGATEYGGGIAASGAFLPDASPTRSPSSRCWTTTPTPAFTLRRRQRAGQPALRHRDPRRQRRRASWCWSSATSATARAPASRSPTGSTSTAAPPPQLGITKTPVEIALAPASGTAAHSRPAPGTRRPHASAPRGVPRGQPARWRSPRARRADPTRRQRRGTGRRAGGGQAGDRRRQPDPHPPLLRSARARALRAAVEPVAGL